jgi:hypothetical protein
MPKCKKLVSLPRKVVKSHFFLPRSQQDFEDPLAASIAEKPVVGVIFPRVQAPRDLYNDLTGEAYAQWINNEAVCLETGEVLFRARARSYEDGEAADDNDWRFYDFSPPVFRRPDDPTIYTDELLRDGVITMEDFRKNGASLTLEKVDAWRATKSG